MVMIEHLEDGRHSNVIAKFDGRAGRAEYWWFVPGHVFIVTSFCRSSAQIAHDLHHPRSLLGWRCIDSRAIAVAIRRLHDTNKSGWFLLIALIP